jgi:hypothetical protein
VLTFRRFLLITVLLSLFILSFTGCGESPTLDFFAERVALSTRYAHKRSDGDISSHSFQLERPILIGERAKSLALEMPVDFGTVRLELLDGQEIVLEEQLENGRGIETIEFRIPLPPGFRFDTLVLHYPESDIYTFPVAAGIREDFLGVRFLPDYAVDTRIKVYDHAGPSSESINFDLSALVRGLKGLVQIRLDYRFEGAARSVAGSAAQSVAIQARAGSQSAEFVLRPAIGASSIFFYEGICDFVPESLEIHTSVRGFELIGLSVLSLPVGDDSHGAPLPADMGAVISYRSAMWRHDDYELFSWNLFPEIIIIDTASYKIQSDYFKRLAFFVEKAATAGSLASDEFLKDKHGWNAHDYQASDLARFFSRAAIENFPLNPREVHLVEILLENGLLKEEDGEYQPGKGGIISLSQESEPRLRSLFMVHEGYHGIFFSNSQYRAESFNTWNALSELEQNFWKEFLKLRKYNVNDLFLIVNEFQAYLMQVEEARLDAYYWDYTVPGLAEAVPRIRNLIERLGREYPDTFHKSAKFIEAAVRKAAGIGAEDLVCLTRITESM